MNEIDPSQQALQVTEQSHFASEDIDARRIEDMVRLFQTEETLIAKSLKNNHQDICFLVNRAVEKLKCGGRIIYAGAGTSGRIGFIDAVECAPTYSMDQEKIFAIMAGGTQALWSAVEGAEDDTHQAVQDAKSHQINEKDIVIGLSASGKTPYVRSILAYAQSLGAFTALVSSSEITNQDFPAPDYGVHLKSGKELVTGSTRMKAGSATKIFLNTFSSCTMISLGRTFGNQMIDLKLSNTKLSQRALRILKNLGVAEQAPGQRIKNKLVSQRFQLPEKEGQTLLNQYHGSLRDLYLGEFDKAQSHIDAVIFDMDGTIVHYDLPRGFSTWAALGWAYDIYGEMEQWIDAYRNQSISYHDIWIKCAQKLKGQRTAAAEEMYFSSAGSAPMHRGFRDLIHKCQLSGVVTGLITSGVKMVSEHVKKELNLNFDYGNHFPTQNGKFTGEILLDVPFTDKTKAFLKAVAAHNLSLDRVCYVGDSDNDYAILAMVGHPVFYVNAFNDGKRPPTPVTCIHDFYELFHLILNGKRKS